MSDPDCTCHEREENLCSDCENPLGRFNFTGVCKACQKERDQEKADAELERTLFLEGLEP